MARGTKFNLVAESEGKRHRVAKIIFGASEGIFVTFPRFIHTRGLVSRATLRGGISLPADISLKDGGKVAGHLVKYAHHLDGEAHFSQHGLVRASVRNASGRLDANVGHIFTLQAQRLEGFAPPRESDRTPALTMQFREVVPTLKITGWWYRMDKLETSGTPGLGPLLVQGPNGQRKPAFALVPPEYHPLANWVLLLVPEIMPLLSANGAPSLTFIGGFDRKEIVHDHAEDTHFLALMYPVEDFETLKQELGAIDL